MPGYVYWHGTYLHAFTICLFSLSCLTGRKCTRRHLNSKKLWNSFSCLARPKINILCLLTYLRFQKNVNEICTYIQTMFFVSSNKELMVLKRALIYEFDSKVHSNLCSCPTECIISPSDLYSKHINQLPNSSTCTNFFNFKFLVENLWSQYQSPLDSARIN